MIGYLITNLINGKRYVGKTTHTISERWSQHLSIVRRGLLRCPHLHAAIRKHGAENFVIDELMPLQFDIATETELNDWEVLMIRLLRTRESGIGYNLTPGGDGRAGWVPSEKDLTRLRENGKRSGTLAVASGQVRHMRTSESCCKGGRIQGEQNRNSGQISAMVTKMWSDPDVRARWVRQAKIRAEKNTHIRWHVKRGLVNPKCSLCQGVSC